MRGAPPQESVGNNPDPRPITRDSELRTNDRPPTTALLCSEPPHPDAACGGLAEVHGLPGRAQRYRFVVFAVQHFYGRRRTQMQPFQKFQELLVLLVDAQYFGRFLGPQIRQQYRSLPP